MAQMNPDEMIIERARRLRESGPSVDDKRWMARQVLEGRISAHKMSKLSKLGYTTVRRIRDHVASNRFLKSGNGRPMALDELSMASLRTVRRLIESGVEGAKTTQEWRAIIEIEHLNTFRRRFLHENMPHALSRRSMKRYLLTVGDVGVIRMEEELQLMPDEPQ